MIYTYCAVAQMDDTGSPGTFSQWHCDCGKTINNNVLVGKLVGLLVGKAYHKILKDGVSLPTSSAIA